jgi:hypothetical protein
VDVGICGGHVIMARESGTFATILYVFFIICKKELFEKTMVLEYA